MDYYLGNRSAEKGAKGTPGGAMPGRWWPVGTVGGHGAMGPIMTQGQVCGGELVG